MGLIGPPREVSGQKACIVGGNWGGGGRRAKRGIPSAHRHTETLALDGLSLDEILQVGNGAGDKVLLGLLVGEGLEDVRLDSLDEVGLLALADSLLVPNPGVKNRLGLGRKGSLLAEGEVLGLEGGGLL